MTIDVSTPLHRAPAPRPFPLRVATLAAIAASAGDLLMLLAANAMRPELSMPAVPSALLWVGAALGAVAIPFYAFGYSAVASHVAAPSIAWSIRGAGFVGAIVGSVVHMRTAMLIHSARGAAVPAGDPMQQSAADPVLMWLWSAASAAILIASMAFTLAVIRRQIDLPDRTRLLNPVVITMALAIAGSLSTYGQAFLVPLAPNVAHWLWFNALSRLLAQKRGQVPF